MHDRDAEPVTSVHPPDPLATHESEQPSVPDGLRAADMPTMLLVPGATPVPDYKLVRLLGRGGCGEVWRATGPGGFDVALKFIPLGGPEARVEVRSLELFKSIRHAHLLTMFGTWHRDGYLIIAMELADRTLHQRAKECLEQGQSGIPPEELLEYMREAAKGLDYLNEARHPGANGDRVGIQHKDVKPQNLLLVGGVVKVADFGLAQVLEKTVASASGGLTPAYAAPEFFEGRATRWSDQYSLAVSYCHLRGGRLPFTGSALQMMAGHTRQPPDLSMVPEAERSALEKALAKEPENRWSSCRVFIEALAADWAVAEGLAVHEPSGNSTDPPADAPTDYSRRPREDGDRITLGELKKSLASTDRTALIVPPKILRRVIKGEYDVPYLLTDVPHERCWFFDREALFRYVEQEELALEPEQRLPSTVILLAAPTDAQLQNDRRATLLSRTWRMLFHAHVHLALHARNLTAADVRERIEKIGATEFAEIRAVLQKEGYLLPPADDLSSYSEFAAVYLELRYFRQNLVKTYFPAIEDPSAIDGLLAQDVDALTLFNRTRLRGAPEPEMRADRSSDDSNTYFYRLARQAERAEDENDLVRAAILRTKAARVAPPSLANDTHRQAQRNLRTLAEQLQEALKLPPEDASRWMHVLPALLDKADQGQWPVEAKLLYDLQKICHEHGQKLYMLDLVEWAMTAGKRPIRRPLTMLSIVHATNYLRTATQRLTTIRVSDDDRKQLNALIQHALSETEGDLRRRIRPILYDAFHDVGLKPSGPAEEVALDKMIEELLDQVTQKGFFTFSDLRDTISSNQLKLPDLDPGSFLHGDPLRRLDRRLTAPLEGVYRHGELYLRWMETGSSLFSGTWLGRLITLNLLLSFGVPFALLEGLRMVWNEYTKSNPRLEIDKHLLAYVPFGLAIWCLMHFPGLRAWTVRALHHTVRGLRFALFEVPLRVWRLRWPRRILQSLPVVLLLRYLLLPLCVWLVLWRTWREPFGSWPAAGLTVVCLDLLIYSRPITHLAEMMMEGLVLAFNWLRVDAVRGLVRLINYFFKHLTELLETVLYTVDEWMRFRSGEGQLKTAMRAVLGALWFPVRSVIRFYFITLIEPSINPLKLPISILAAKFIYLIPGYLPLMTPGTETQTDFIKLLSPHISRGFAELLTYVFVIPTLWLLPSAVAFIVWEVTRNWRLFRANRPTDLQPVAVGTHGETMLQLLRAGAHSGTVPKIYAELRRAERRAYYTNDWQPARTCRAALAEVQRAVQVFVEREFIAILHHSKHWASKPLSVRAIIVSSRRILVELKHAELVGEALCLALEEQSAWLIAGVHRPGWLHGVPLEQTRTLKAALAGFYKLSGVNFVREQLAKVIPSRYQLTDHYLIVEAERPVAYDLRDTFAPLAPEPLDGKPVHAPTLPVEEVLYSQVPIAWERWDAYWRADQEGEERALLKDGVRLLPS